MPILVLLFAWLGLIANTQTFPPPSVIGSDCPSIGGCGVNGTRLTGLAIDVPDEIRAVGLPSGELITLR